MKRSMTRRFSAPTVRARAVANFERLETRMMLFAVANQSLLYNDAIAVQSNGDVLHGLSQSDGSLIVRRLTAAGKVDSSYGRNGKAIVPITGKQPKVGSLLVLPDDSLIVGGFAGATFELVHLKTDGSIDANFGTGGVATATFSSGTALHDLAVQNNGAIVAVGLEGSKMALARFTAAGALDHTFNSTGTIQQDIPGNHEEINAVAIQSDGKIVVAGDSSDTHNHSHDTVVRYTAAGALDTTFDGTGERIFGTIDRSLTGVAIESHGKILVSGDSSPFVQVMRLNGDGTTDTTYGSSGTATFGGLPQGDSNGADVMFASSSDLVLQSDDKTVVAGSFRITNGPTTAVVLRFNTDGTADSSFGTAGVSKLQVTEQDVAAAIVLAPGNKLVVALATDLNFTGVKPVVAQLNSSGTLDSTFGNGGTVLDSQVSISSLNGVVTITGTDVDDQIILTVGANNDLLLNGGKRIGLSSGGEQDLHQRRRWQ